MKWHIRRALGTIGTLVFAVSVAGCATGDSELPPEPSAIASHAGLATSPSPVATKPPSGGSPIAGEGAPGTGDGRPLLPSAVVTPAKSATLGAAPGQVRARFSGVDRAIGTLVTGTRIESVRVAGRDVGGLATYTVSPGAASSVQFQDQFVVQLLSIVSKGTTARFIRINDRVVAIADGKVAAAGWFSGNRAMLMIRDGATPELDVLAASIIRLSTGQ